MNLARLGSLSIGAARVNLPVYFPSISSVKTSLYPHEYLLFLSSFVGLNSQFLVSAFDIANSEHSSVISEKLTFSRSNGAIALMDSGNYESFWKNAQGKWTQKKFHKILNDFPCDLAFCFDEQTPPQDKYEHADLVVKRLRNDQEAMASCLIIPIVHAEHSDLPFLCSLVAKLSNVPIVAVAERKLGDGIYSRAKTVQLIRNELNKLGRYVALHLLGTGNPISMAIYTAMGADSFDGLEWCQTVVDHDTGLLYHLSHADFFSKQTNWGDLNLSFQAKTLAHNLEFYSGWMFRLRESLSQNKVNDFCRNNLPGRACKLFTSLCQ